MTQDGKKRSYLETETERILSTITRNYYLGKKEDDLFKLCKRDVSKNWTMKRKKMISRHKHKKRRGR